MKITGINTATQIQALAKVVDRAERLGYIIDEYTEAGYNSNSGYIYLCNEDWGYITLGIADYAYNRGEDVECILLEPCEGMEFFGKTPEDCESQYRTWAREMLLDGVLCESDVIEF